MIFSSVDFNECQMRGSTLCTCADGSYGNCGAQCNNTHGSFSCSCGDGFRLLGKTKCVGVYVAQLNTIVVRQKLTFLVIFLGSICPFNSVQTNLFYLSVISPGLLSRFF